MKFKIGDKVRVINKDDKYYDRVGEIITKYPLSYFYWEVKFDSGDGVYDEYELKKEENMFDVGDIVENKDNKRKVLAVIGDLTALSYFDDFNSLSYWYTKKELEDSGYKLATEETTLSMQEVADKFGVDVDKLKIKKDK